MPSVALPHPPLSRARRPWLALALVAWLAAALVAGLAGAFTGRPPIPLGVAALTPVLASLVALAVSPAARSYVRSLDLMTLTLVHVWRVGGVLFVALWAIGKLPAGFALPAGLGDIAVGITAPLVAFLVVPRLRALRGLYLAWTAFGALDLIVAVSSGIVHGVGAGAPGGASSSAIMGTVPLSLIPTYLVPLAMILHLAAAYQVLAGRVEAR